MVLSDRTIKEELAGGRLVITPLDEQDIQPASVDVHLDRVFRVFKVSSRPYIDVREQMDDLTEE
ncbi:MAG: dCTP deaminase, partial [Dehalococcoidia bacterium]